MISKANILNTEQCAVGGWKLKAVNCFLEFLPDNLAIKLSLAVKLFIFHAFDIN